MIGDDLGSFRQIVVQMVDVHPSKRVPFESLLWVSLLHENSISTYEMKGVGETRGLAILDAQKKALDKLSEMIETSESQERRKLNHA